MEQNNKIYCIPWDLSGTVQRLIFIPKYKIHNKKAIKIYINIVITIVTAWSRCLVLH